MKVIVTTLLFVTLKLTAQTSVGHIQQEIDTTLWKTFQTAYESLDGPAANATYAAEVLRVTPAGIDTAGAFKSQNIKRFDTYKRDQVTLKLDFWFDQRHTNKTTSYEVGFYRLTFTLPSGQIDTFYGQFHIVLKKINGMWRIVQDWDTTTIAGVPITKEMFERKEPLRF